MKREIALVIGADGITVTTAASSAQTAIPNTAAGDRPRYIQVTATAESYFKLGVTTAVATANSLLVQPADSRLLSVGSNTHFAVIQGAAPGKVNVLPVEGS